MKRESTPVRNAKWHEPQIRKLISEGLSQEQIANELNISKASLINYCRILKVRIPRKKRSGEMKRFNEESMEGVIGLRKGGATLAEIGRAYGVSRERIRQVLAKYAPDVAIQSRIPHEPVMRTCSVCGKPHPYRAKTCSQACASVGSKINKWDRDRMVVLMDMRAKGCTWEKIGKTMEPSKPSGSFRVDIERYAKWLMSTEEFNNTFKKRCATSTPTDFSQSEDTKENDQTKPIPDGLVGPKKTFLDSAVNWLRSRL